MARFLQARPPGRPKSGPPGWSGEAEFPDDLAALGEFLCLREWEKGKVRKPGSVTLFSEDGVLKACISDKETGDIAFVSGHSWVGLLGALEDGLRACSLEWRAQRSGGRR